MNDPMPAPQRGAAAETPAAPGAPEGLGNEHLAAAEGLFAQLYADLRQLASSRLRQAGDMTLLNTTDLLHETFMRLRQAAPPAFPDKRYFLAYAARTMRSVVVDLVRSRQAERRGGLGPHERMDTDEVNALAQDTAHDAEVLRVNEALADLAKVEPRLATVVELRYFGGLTEAEVAALLQVTQRTVQRDWAKARIFLSLALK